ncbi:MAG: hypothetical protein LQ348_003083 [Seirophora lacunosa]|nr:MAG: hypothetical protein LQ344_006755 [Seirophora lacunosa]KAI4192656.1 MAG: hypothetical protein LQ348_003083 [Seirophora lacunosa]
MVSLSRAQNPYDPKAKDVTSNGNYLIKRCGKGIRGGKAEQLVSLLREIAADLPSIIAEANTGVQSAHGFKSLFTSDDAIPTVKGYLTNISRSATVTIDGQPKQVAFVCLERVDPFTAAVYHDMTRRPFHNITAGTSEFGTPNINLPPLFFRLRRTSRPLSCPRFDRKHATIHQEFGATQYGTLIHELLDKYLDFNGRDRRVKEVYGLRNVIKLSADRQLLNAENYNLFASGEFKDHGFELDMVTC